MSYQFAAGFIGGCLVSTLMAISFNAAAKKPGIEVQFTPQEAGLIRFCSLDPTPAHEALEQGIRELRSGNPHPVVRFSDVRTSAPSQRNKSFPCHSTSSYTGS